MNPEIIHFTKTRLILISFLIVFAFIVTGIGTLLKEQNQQRVTPLKFTEPSAVEELEFSAEQTDKEKKALLFRRTSSVEIKPLSRTERDLILSQYGNGSNLSETEMEVLIDALNK